MKALIVAWALMFANPASSQTVVDGDTIRLGVTPYRLWGIDAPEQAQTCDGGWPAGNVATQVLINLMQGRTVTCENREIDRYGRIIALCRADGNDLSAAMVRLGMARAYVRYSTDYLQEEELAQRQRLGIHGHNCMAPWQWRRR